MGEDEHIAYGLGAPYFPMSFHNTIHNTGDKLKAAEGRCEIQRMAVLNHFVNTRPNGHTPSEVQQALNIKLITSVRRTMTNLTSDGVLIKTSAQRLGPEGENEHIWILSSQYKEVKTLFDE